MENSLTTSAQKRISAVVAMAENQVIGADNQLLWRLPADLKHFKSLTTGHVVVMGRKTFESIGRPLPNRTNIVITRHPDYQAQGCIVVTSIEAVMQQLDLFPQQEIFIIGGEQIYSQFMPHIERIYMTIVHHHFSGDTYFPTLNFNEWQEIARQNHEADAENTYAYSFVILHRKWVEQRTLNRL